MNHEMDNSIFVDAAQFFWLHPEKGHVMRKKSSGDGKEHRKTSRGGQSQRCEEKKWHTIANLGAHKRTAISSFVIGRRHQCTS